MLEAKQLFERGSKGEYGTQHFATCLGETLPSLFEQIPGEETQARQRLEAQVPTQEMSLHKSPWFSDQL